LSRTLRTPLGLLGGLLALYLVAPFAVFLSSLGRGASPGPGMGTALATSLATATVSTAIIAVLGIPLAYCLAGIPGWAGSLLWMVVALPIAVPPLISGLLLLDVVGPYTPVGSLFGGSLTDTPAGIVLAQTFVAAPFLVIAARAAFQAVDPSLEEVARTLGHGAAGRFVRVAVPAAWAGIRAGLLLAWLRAFGEFGATLIVAYHPYSLPIFTWVQFSSTGLSASVPPIGLALAAALAVLALSQLPSARLPHRVGVGKALRLGGLAAPGDGGGAAPGTAGLNPPASGPLTFSVSARVGSFRLQLQQPSGSRRLALLGPSGAGKSLTLRLLAGTAPGRADIRLGDLALGGLPAERRGVGYLPQASALMPRLTVREQVAFAVGADPRLASQWLERLGLGGLEDRLPAQLSGGQQRRVALARALARRPALLLMDEPFGALDAPVRARLRRELRRLQRESDLTTVLVTHDPEEAALLADDVIVLDQGRALQQGPVAAVLAHPVSPRVAALVGTPNAHRGTVLRPGWIAAGGLELAAPTAGLAPGSEVVWTVPPEAIAVDGERSPTGALAGTVLDSVLLGGDQEVTILLGGLQLIARRARGEAPAPGPCRVALPAEALTVWAAGADGSGGAWL
jgi:ABC-type sulfate/molybdate transport systems ATPase subunit/ABC-type sulfate transport system permease component